MPLARARMIGKYIFFELLPVLLMGILLFIFILFMFQSFKLTEYVVVHGAKFSTVLQLFSFFILGFLPIVLPTALLFSILLVYGRLSQDSEVVAMKAIGIHPFYFSLPAWILGLMVTLFAWQISSSIAPWGNRKAIEITHKLGQNRPTVTVREGVFSEGFFDLVVYANEVDASKGTLKKIFIFDEREPKSPLTIIANEGEMLTEKTDAGNKAVLRLKSGNMHRTSKDNYTKIDFNTYDINLFDPAQYTQRELDVESMNMSALNERIESSSNDKIKLEARQEWFRRITFPFACLVFSTIGLGLGTVTNRRLAKTGSLVVCISVLIIYWMLYAGFETLGRQGHLPLFLSSWAPNIFGLIFGLYHWIKMSRV